MRAQRLEAVQLACKQRRVPGGLRAASAVGAPTAERPRKWALVPVAVSCQAYPGLAPLAGATPRRRNRPASARNRFTTVRNRNTGQSVLAARKPLPTTDPYHPAKGVTT